MKSAILWEGPSRINGAPIALIATGLDGRSSNRKTGRLVQTWIIPTDIDPVTANRTNADVSVCGSCPLRGKNGKNRVCYVNLGQAPLGIYRAYRRGAYKRLKPSDVPKGLLWRFGAWGDPAAVPSRVWKMIRNRAAGHTGYTHQWKSPKLRDALEFCQASVDQVRDLEILPDAARAWFRVIPDGGSLRPDETLCPASANDSVQCVDCMACDGTSKIAIFAHGSGASKLVQLQPRARK